MTDFKDAKEIILRYAAPLGTEERAFDAALGFVLARDVKAREAIPLFDSSAVDGFTVHRDEIRAATTHSPITLPIQTTVQAGDTNVVTLRHGYAIKILTGAPVPRGANAVVMKEDVTCENDSATFSNKIKTGANIRRRGEEYRRGWTALEAGTLITPPVVGLLATLGKTTVTVYRKPRVALVITGNELRPPAAALKHGQIRESNSFAVVAALRALGIHGVKVIRCADRQAILKKKIDAAMRSSDVVITSGGVSVGDYDYVKDVMRELGVTTRLWGVAMKPGKPFYFGTKGSRRVFGLPGNPVAALLSFHLLVRPALMKAMGDKRPSELRIKAEAATTRRKTTKRIEFLRATLLHDRDGRLVTHVLNEQESHMMSGLALADCLVPFEKESTEMRLTETVEALFLHWSQM